MRQFLSGIGALDTRALALLRIGAGILVVVDVLSRIGMVREHYSGEGILPLEAWHAVYRSPGTWSVHLASGETSVQILLMLAAMLAGVSLVLGIRTRWSTALAWLLTFSLQSRNPGLCHGGDIELRMILFWGFFLPWDRHYALGTPSRWSLHPPYRAWSAATVAYCLQIALVYFASALLKTGDHWREDFSAVYYTLNIGAFSRPQGLWLASHFGLTRVLTAATLAFEFFAPLLLLVSGSAWKLRVAVVFGFFALHAGFFAFLQLSTFPLICIVSMLAFLPAPVFDSKGSGLGGRLQRADDFLASVRSRASTKSPVVRWFLGAGAALPRPVRHAESAIVTLCLAYVLAWNAGTISKTPSVPAFLHPIGRALGLHQTWGMFINKTSSSYWIVTVARTQEGTELDALTDQPPRWERPRRIDQLFGDFRSGRHRAGLGNDRGRIQRAAYADFLCREVQRERGPVEDLEIWFAFQGTPLPGQRRPRPQRRMVIRRDCRPLPVP